jgi:hypothetical protein
MRVRTMVPLVVAALVALVGEAEARPVHFLGPHPIPRAQGGGYCYIDAPHLHAFGPDHVALYQQVGDEYVFTGDPTPFGYDGEKHVFYGHHPMVGVPGQPVHCYIEGPHFHAFAPPPTPDYRIQNNVAFYVGPELVVKPARVKLVNAEYRPFVALRPTVSVVPPPEWRGQVYTPSVALAAPGVIVAPPPSVSVEVGAPRVYVAPQPPVVVGAPGVVVVQGSPTHEEVEAWKHAQHEQDEAWKHAQHEREEAWKHAQHDQEEAWKHARERERHHDH